MTLLTPRWRLIVPDKKNRLAVKLFNLVEGEAEGQLAIIALLAVVVLVLVVWRFS
jgi:hypothetical protein